MASSLSDIHPTSFSHLFAKTFFCHRSFCPAPSSISFNRFVSSSSTATLNCKIIIKSASSQTNTTVPSYNAYSLKAAIFKTLALKVGNELNNGTLAPSTRLAFFKIMYNVFRRLSKKIPFEHYYRLHLSGPNVAICETKYYNVFVLAHTSFDQNNFYFLHVVQEAAGASNEVLKDFGLFQRLAPYDPSKHPTQPNPANHTQNFQPGFL